MRTHFWNLVLTGFFIILVAAGVRYLAAAGVLYLNVPPMDFLLISLAIYRLVRLFTYDTITEFVREWFREGKPGSLSKTLDTLLNCPWCTGLWFSFIVVFGYYATPYAWPLILILAAAALGSFFQVVTNLIGWHAEDKKHEVREKRGIVRP